MELLKKTDTEQALTYEKFVQNHENGCFMQSLCWTKVKSNWRWEAVIARDTQGRLSGTMLILVKELPMGMSMLYAPRGPVCNYDDRSTLNQLMDGARQVAKRYHALFLRCDPAVPEGKQTPPWLESLGFQKRKNQTVFTTVQPSANYQLSLQGKAKEQVFEEFHSKCRYNIRLADRKGVRCCVCGREGMDDFYALLCETGARDHFAVRSKQYYEKLMEVLGDHARLYLCDWNGIPLCGALCIRYGSRVTYLYGASSALHREKMAGYLMQWKMISWAVDSGCSVYDFGGISYYQQPEKRGYGVYRFKQGFSGTIVRYVGDFDLYFHRWARPICQLERPIRLGRYHFLHLSKQILTLCSEMGKLFEKHLPPWYNRTHNTTEERNEI